MDKCSHYSKIAFTFLCLPLLSARTWVSLLVCQVWQATVWEGSIISAPGSLFSVFQLEVAAAMEQTQALTVLHLPRLTDGCPCWWVVFFFLSSGNRTTGSQCNSLVGQAHPSQSCQVLTLTLWIPGQALTAATSTASFVHVLRQLVYGLFKLMHVSREDHAAH